MCLGCGGWKGSLYTLYSRGRKTKWYTNNMLNKLTEWYSRLSVSCLPSSWGYWRWSGQGRHSWSNPPCLHHTVSSYGCCETTQIKGLIDPPSSLSNEGLEDLLEGYYDLASHVVLRVFPNDVVRAAHYMRRTMPWHCHRGNNNNNIWKILLFFGF